MYSAITLSVTLPLLQQKYPRAHRWRPQNYFLSGANPCNISYAVFPFSRCTNPEAEVKYYVSNGDATTPLGVLALVACSRHRVEESFGDCKSYLGMARYETRSYVGWHRHMGLVGLAHLKKWQS